MHEADDAKDNQREWLGPRKGDAQNSSAQGFRPLCQGTIIAGVVRKSDLAEHARGKLWGKCCVQVLTSLLQSRDWSILPNLPNISMIAMTNSLTRLQMTMINR
jgi:hypothetical protein